MMTLKFNNLNCRFENGMHDLLAWHGILERDGGIAVTVRTENNGKIKIMKDGDDVTFVLDREYQVFRAVTLLKQNYDKACFEYEEPCCFETCGAMFDGSQASSLMTVDSCKKMMLILAGMGFNMMMLYCEDCYDVEGEPYWGNMRPRYTAEEFRQLDDYAYSLGIEMIPCIQTLGHLKEAIKKPPYKVLSDTPTALLVGDEKVYELIEKLIGTVSSCFRSRRIHLGLDEAVNLGLGRYLNKHGYTHHSAIMEEHLGRICDITRRYGLSPMMWEDMFFRVKSGGYGFSGYLDGSVTLTAEDRRLVPDEMSLIYWDYYHFDESHYEKMIKQSQLLTDKLIFAGCARNVYTFAAHYEKTLAATEPALSACKRLGIKEVFATVWGDDHRESSNFAILPGLQLFAEHMYCENPTAERVRHRFEACANADWQAFADISSLDCFPGHIGENLDNISVTRACMWQDILLGMCDCDLGEQDFETHFEELKNRLKASAERNAQFEKIFIFYHHLAKVLETKATMGMKLTKAYRNHNLPELKMIAEEQLPKLYADIDELRLAHRAYFFEEYKPIGWEVLDIRYGGAIARVETAMWRIKSYLNGTVKRIDELEEERLSLSGTGKLPIRIPYTDICSASSL